MAQGFSLKDQLFNPAKVARLGREIHAAWDGFDPPRFEARVCARLPELELKARIAWIAEVLDEMLPQDFDHAARVIEAALPPPLDPALSDGDFGDFIYAPYGEVGVRRGLETHRDRLLDLLEAVTQRLSRPSWQQLCHEVVAVDASIASAGPAFAAFPARVHVYGVGTL